jgi:hypothetical protein
MKKKEPSFLTALAWNCSEKSLKGTRFLRIGGDPFLDAEGIRLGRRIRLEVGFSG